MADALPAVSFRASAVGGDVSEPRVCPTNALALRRRVILLIHGFNVDEEHGRAAYERFVARLREMLVVQRDGPVAGDRLVAVYWPGDADWGFAKPLAYMRSVPRARDIGARLAQLLDDAAAANGLVEVDIVAHSLGCRLALEALLAVHGNPQSRVHIRRIQLMAAAVPTFMLFDPDDAPRLRDAFEQSLEIGAKSLYSAADGVLSFAFPPGQTFAGDGEGFLPTAVGHAKFPVQSELTRMDPIEMPDAGHGSYWSGDYPDESATVAYIAHDFLQLPDALERATPQRASPRRAIAEAPAIAARSTPDRTIGESC